MMWPTRAAASGWFIRTASSSTT
ncbi:UNVERIFIED_CONTAM: hypothetical protein GTU68_027314 [Idotea baltica]|nr:hypothetical protein [Idotea baltica]